MNRQCVNIRNLDFQDYATSFRDMKSFTDDRGPDTPDEIWTLQHYPVFTQGQAGKAEHVLDPGDIPVVQSDRGGQVTYHGPGQLVAYLMLDLKRKGMNVRGLVSGIEDSIIALLADYGIEGLTRKGAPGVYVEEAKVASLGLRIRKGCSYHGLALNVDMDIEPFSRIHPCGYEGLSITQLRDLGVMKRLDEVRNRLLSIMTRHFGYHYVFEGNISM